MKEYILSVSVAIMVCVVVTLLIPSPKYAGIIKIACGLFVVNILINPIKGIFKNKTFSFGMDSFVYEGDFHSKAHHAEKDFDEILKEKREEILSSEVTTNVKKLWNSSISVEVTGDEAMVNNAEKKDFENIKKYLKDHYGLTAVLR